MLKHAIKYAAVVCACATAACLLPLCGINGALVAATKPKRAALEPMRAGGCGEAATLAQRISHSTP